MDPNQNDKKKRGSKTGSTGAKPGGKKNKKKDRRPPDEETPITVSGGSLKVVFDRDFMEDEMSSTKTVRKVKHPDQNARFTHIVITVGQNGPELFRYPQVGLELGQGCFIHIKGRSG